jgi:hypothetical protein
LIIPDGGVMRTSLCQVTPFELMILWNAVRLTGCTCPCSTDEQAIPWNPLLRVFGKEGIILGDIYFLRTQPDTSEGLLMTKYTNNLFMVQAITSYG